MIQSVERAGQGTGGDTLVMIPLAMNQTTFYVGVAERLRAQGRQVVFVPFHEGSVEYARARGFVAINPFEEVAARSAVSGGAAAERAAAYEARFGIDNLTRLLSHEMEAYELRSTDALIDRLCRYLDAADAILRRLRAEHGRITVVQELGGFLSVVAFFHAARALDLPHVFMEPSFFRGRIFFVRDRFSAPVVDTLAPAVGDAVRGYLADAAAAQRIVIPSKDRHHYQHPIRKVLRRKNVRRLFEKSFEKHVLGRQEEFSHIGGHVRRHLRAAATASRLRRHYRDIPDGPFVYYPLHVPADVALTLRAPQFLDQYTLIDYIARVAPIGHRVVFKEHPAMIGAVRHARVRELLEMHDNVVLLSPGINNYRVLERAAAVVTVNSKSGAEALLLRRPVVALGDSFYRRSPLVEAPPALDQLSEALMRALRRPAPSEEEIARYFQAVWDASHPGELHDDRPANCDAFAASLTAYLAERKAA